MSYRIYKYLFKRKGVEIYLTIFKDGEIDEYISLEQDGEIVNIDISELQNFIDLLNEVASVVGVKKKENKENILKKIKSKMWRVVF